MSVGSFWERWAMYSVAPGSFASTAAAISASAFSASACFSGLILNWARIAVTGPPSQTMGYQGEYSRRMGSGEVLREGRRGSVLSGHLQRDDQPLAVEDGVDDAVVPRSQTVERALELFGARGRGGSGAATVLRGEIGLTGGP